MGESAHYRERNEFLVLDWNAAHPVGTDVSIMKDDGGTIQTWTASTAWVSQDFGAVLMAEGVLGCVHLSRITAIDAAALA